MEKITIEEAKSKYGAVQMVENTDEKGNPIVCYFKQPSRLVLGAAMGEIDRNPLIACEYIFDDSVIREISDVDAFRNNDAVFLGITAMLQSLVRVKKSTFTNL